MNGFGGILCKVFVFPRVLVLVLRMEQQISVTRLSLCEFSSSLIHPVQFVSRVVVPPQLSPFFSVKNRNGRGSIFVIHSGNV